MKDKNKLPKLRDLVCVICKSQFQRHISPSEIKSGRGKVCSMKCKHLLNGIQKKSGEWRNCKTCGRKIWARKSEDRRGGIRGYCSKECFGTEKKERIMSTDGYWVVHTPNGDIKEHRWVMEQYIKRRLKSLEIVHHKNHNKLDNRIENLEITTRGNHNKHHFIKKIKQYTLSGKFIKEWDGLSEASRKLKINTGRITECVKGKRKSLNGYIWKYA